ncbi:39S ribosomal protein L34, mitochondrial, partial [Eschrichtius robustus]|nr:39S ribosomal protein L34, mitochondrial [Eschrichtius robustus]
MSCTHAHAEEAPFACHLLVHKKNYTLLWSFTLTPKMRWLQPRAWLGLPDAWGLPAVQQTRGKARGNEYQPSNIKRKNKHGWVRRLSKPNGVQVILRRMHKGRKSLSH